MKPTAESHNLNFLRAFAVLTVYFGHLLQTFGVEHVVGRITIYDFAQTGVLIFFVHTSLVLMFSLDRLRSHGWVLFRTFAIRRVFRIYPLSIVMVLVLLLFHIPDFPTNQYHWIGWRTLAANLSLTQNIGTYHSFPAVLWSLPFEIQMYVVLPLIFFVLQRFKAWWIPLVLWALMVAVLIGLWLFSVRLNVATFLQFTPCFMGGIIAYRLWPYKRGFSFIGWPLSISVCIGLRVIAEFLSFPHAAIVSGWVACLLLGITAPQFRELNSRWMHVFVASIAKYSYGIYLSHCAVFWVAFVFLKAPLIAQWIVCVALSILLPIAMFHWIEEPMIRLGKQMSTTGKSKPTPEELPGVPQYPKSQFLRYSELQANPSLEEVPRRQP